MPLLAFDPSSLREVPEAPGVYLFLDDRKRMVYVGKATRLRSRVRSYFGKGDDRLATVLLARHARHIDFIVTETEKEALLLENGMIKKHAPRFNIRLRDDKTYFSLRLDPSETWPWFTIVRKRKKEDGVFYFGPYTSALACRRTLQYINKTFPLRTCTDSVLSNRSRPCISHEIKQCVAPCVGYVERAEYMKIVDEAILFMKGKNKELVADLKAQMATAAAAQDYERAIVVRDRIEAIETTVAQPNVTKNAQESFDVIGLYRGEGEWHLVVLFVRDGVLSSSASFRFPEHHETDELLRGFLGQFYSGERQVPPEIILPDEAAEMHLMGEMLTDLRGAEVKLTVPERGEKRRHLAMAEKNAELAWLQRHQNEAETAALLAGLQKKLDLVRTPRRIECYDISNLMGTHVVGSGVAFVDGRPDKQRYRRYRIRSVEGQDDFASMAEVLRRRIVRGQKEDDLPDLFVIDGGKGQLGAVHTLMRELKIDSVDLVSLAKAKSGSRADVAVKTKERVFKPELPIPVILDQKSPEMRLLVRIRDEAHRFAITYHRRLRSKEQVTSMLELVPGIGKSRARELLRTFGSVTGVREAADSDLGAVKGMSEKVIAQLREFFDTRGNVALEDPNRESDD